MAVAVIMQGGTREQYDAVNEKINAEGVPEGIVLHAAAETPNGIRMVDVWETREAFERFMQERIAPIAQELGIDMSAGPGPEILEVFNLVVNEEARV